MDRILVTGASGLVGSALVRRLQSLKCNVHGISSRDCDLRDFGQVMSLFQKIKPTAVYHLAAKVAGIMGNMKDQGSAFLENTLINTHVTESARQVGCRKILGMGTVAMYPFPMPTDPLTEDSIWMGIPHHSERGYGHAKRNMLAQLELYEQTYGMEYVVAVSTNLYGPGDKFDIDHGHVIPSLIRKFSEAALRKSSVTVWGDGSAVRDFLHVDDAVEALIVLMEKGNGPINMVSGLTHTIKETVNILRRKFPDSEVVWDTLKPNGQLYRAFDSSKLFDLGFVPKVSLTSGLESTVCWYQENYKIARH